MNAIAPTLLIVDDHPRMRRLIKSVLGGSGFNILEASNGREAITDHHRFHPSWIIMDVDMPEMDGLTAARIIQQRESKSRIIIITQHDSPAIRAEVDSLQVYAFLQKDFLSDLPALLNFQAG